MSGTGAYANLHGGGSDVSTTVRDAGGNVVEFIDNFTGNVTNK